MPKVVDAVPTTSNSFASTGRMRRRWRRRCAQSAQKRRPEVRIRLKPRALDPNPICLALKSGIARFGVSVGERFKAYGFRI